MSAIEQIDKSYQGKTKIGFWQRALQTLVTTRPSKALVSTILGAAIVSCFATYVTLTQTPEKTDRIFWLLNVNLGLFLTLAVFMARHITKIWTKKKRGAAGSALHVRLVFIFGLLTAIPIILMTFFSVSFFYFGVQGWFSERVSTAVNESLVVAEAYLDEHHQVMRADVMAMANDLNRSSFELTQSSVGFERFIETQSQLRNLAEAIVFKPSGEVLARSKLSLSLEFNPVEKEKLDLARQGGVILLQGQEEQDRVRALIKLNGFVDTFLVVGRFVDGDVIKHLNTASKAVQGYIELEGRRSSFQVSVMLMFIAVGLLLLLSAIWCGLVFAGQIVDPVGRLIHAAERIRKGDLSARVETTSTQDEMSLLGQSFNNMTEQLENQRDALVKANRIIDERRRFMEVVLASTSSGILGVRSDGLITLVNPAGAKLLGVDQDALLGQIVSDILIGAETFLSHSTAKMKTHELDYITPDGAHRKLSIRVTAEADDIADNGLDEGQQSQNQHINENVILTFDDISPLLSAQRKAAWLDVARRIAHEIKNPLTPIQLSADRLNKRYLPQITEDPETFKKCTDTIVRQVTQIGHIVKEFSDFARLPEPRKKRTDVRQICIDAISLQQNAYNQIDFKIETVEVFAHCDGGLITQVLNNILQNAVDAITENQDRGHIQLNLSVENDTVKIIIEDTGPGFPKETLARLTEPYFTTRRKGSGLGLAIVKKIMDDHNGAIILENKDVDVKTEVSVENNIGARVILRFEK